MKKTTSLIFSNNSLVSNEQNIGPQSDLLSHVWLFVIPCTVAHQAPLSMGFSRQEYWSGLPCPSPGDLPDPGIEPRSPELQADSYQLSHQGSQTSRLFLSWCRTPQGEGLFTGPPQASSEQVQNSCNLRNQMRISCAFCDSPDPGCKQNSLTREITRFISEFSTATCGARSSIYKDLRETVI